MQQRISRDFQRHRNKEPFRIERKIPIIVIITLLCNLIAGIWTASKFSSRLENLEISISHYSKIPERMAVLENSNADIRQSLTRIEDNIIKSRNYGY